LIEVDKSIPSLSDSYKSAQRVIFTSQLTYNSTGGGSGRSGKGSLGVFNGEPQLGLGSLVSGRSIFSTGQVECDLGLFRKLLGKVLEQLVVSSVTHDSGSSSAR
jgi:hypothetical protein